MIRFNEVKAEEDRIIKHYTPCTRQEYSFCPSCIAYKDESDRLHNEVNGISYGRHMGIDVPEILEIDLGKKAIVFERIRDEKLSNAIQKKTAGVEEKVTESAEMLAKLHRGFLKNNCGGLGKSEPFMLEMLEWQKKFQTFSDEARYEAVMNDMLEGSSSSVTLGHGDYKAEHIIGGYLIDWEFFGLADPMIDVGSFCALLWRDCLDSRKYSISEIRKLENAFAAAYKSTSGVFNRPQFEKFKTYNDKCDYFYFKLFEESMQKLAEGRGLVKKMVNNRKVSSSGLRKLQKVIRSAGANLHAKHVKDILHAYILEEQYPL